MRNRKLFKILNTLFTDENFLIKNATYRDKFIFDDLIHSLNIVLCYYIATRDNRILTLDEILNNYFAIRNEVPSEEYLNNILVDGFMTHSLPGVEKKYVQDYGFNYFDKLPIEDKYKLQIIRDNLVLLEKTMGECKFLQERMRKNKKEIVDKELFMTFPGAKTIYYSIFAPERLYEGPIDKNLFKLFPVVVGESKKDYLMRIVEYKIKNLNNKNILVDDLLLIANSVLEYYCLSNTSIAFIDIKNIKNIPIYTGIYNDGFDVFESYYKIMESGCYFLKNMFTSEMNCKKEFCNRGNFVTSSSFIDKNSISFVDFPDWYNLRQTYLKRVGIADGKLVRYYDCTEINDKDEISEDIKVLYKKF